MEIVIIISTIVAGGILVIKSESIFRFIGQIDWAEEHLSSEGGTRLLIKLVGILFILGAFLWVTGGLQAILRTIFKPLVGTL